MLKGDQIPLIDMSEYSTSPKVSADCLRSGVGGRNLSPLPVIDAVNYVFGGPPQLDPSTDEVANQYIKAPMAWSFEDDGFANLKAAADDEDFYVDTCFCNPAGTTLTGGSIEDRVFWREQLELPPKQRARKPKDVIQVTGSAWFTQLSWLWTTRKIENLIYLCYRGGSVGSLGVIGLERAVVCITAKGASSDAVNGSGRFAYDSVDEDGRRTPETSNTQSSVFVGLFRDDAMRTRYIERFSGFGAVLSAAS